MAEAAKLPAVPLTDVDTNWLQVVGEGWAAPLRGFMREGTLLQTLHFNSMLVDADNFTGVGEYNHHETDWMQNSFPRERVSMPVPIVLPITDFTRRQIEDAKAVALTNAAGVPLAILRSPEVYELRVREIISRTWGIIDDEHPYIKLLLSPGKSFAVGGEVELLGRIKYGDGLDKYRLTVEELRAAFKTKGADVVYAFQTRNPTHAGHGFLMKVRARPRYPHLAGFGAPPSRDGVALSQLLHFRTRGKNSSSEGIRTLSCGSRRWEAGRSHPTYRSTYE